MRFLLDAQLPIRLAQALTAAGYNSTHTLNLPAANRSSDSYIAARADAEQRIVMTKDSDFLLLHTVKGSPQKLLYVSVGNVSNARLREIITTNLPLIELAFQEADVVELNQNQVTTWVMATD